MSGYNNLGSSATLKLRDQIILSMQDLKDYEAQMAARVHYCETEVLPQRALPIPAWAAPTLQQVYMSAINAAGVDRVPKQHNCQAGADERSSGRSCAQEVTGELESLCLDPTRA